MKKSKKSKKCHRCQKEKLLTEFPKRSEAKDGRMSVCSDPCRILDNERYKAKQKTNNWNPLISDRLKHTFTSTPKWWEVKNQSLINN